MIRIGHGALRSYTAAKEVIATPGVFKFRIIKHSRIASSTKGNAKVKGGRCRSCAKTNGIAQKISVNHYVLAGFYQDTMNPVLHIAAQSSAVYRFIAINISVLAMANVNTCMWS